MCGQLLINNIGDNSHTVLPLCYWVDWIDAHTHNTQEIFLLTESASNKWVTIAACVVQIQYNDSIYQTNLFRDDV